MLRCSVFAAVLAALSFSTPAEASGRQLHGGAGLAFHWFSGTQGSLGGAFALQGAWDPIDWLRIYGQLDYTLSASLAGNPGLYHSGSAAFGAAYVFDALSVTPWLGIGFRTGITSTPTWTGISLGPEARLGVDVLLSRYVALTFQGYVGISALNSAEVFLNVGGSAGVRFTLDL